MHDSWSWGGVVWIWFWGGGTFGVKLFFTGFFRTLLWVLEEDKFEYLGENGVGRVIGTVTYFSKCFSKKNKNEWHWKVW